MSDVAKFQKLRASRTDEEELSDFNYITEQKKLGLTWIEITTQLNTLRDYTLSQRSYQATYNKYLTDKKHTDDDIVKLEKERMIEELDFVILESLKAWRNSCKPTIEKVNFTGKVSGRSKEDIHEELQELYYQLEDLPDAALTDSLVAAKMAQLQASQVWSNYSVEQKSGNGNPAYLANAMKAQERKADLLGLNVPKKTEFDIKTFFMEHKVIIDDSNGRQEIPLSSEREVLAKYDDIEEVEFE